MRRTDLGQRQGQTATSLVAASLMADFRSWQLACSDKILLIDLYMYNASVTFEFWHAQVLLNWTAKQLPPSVVQQLHPLL